MGTIKRTPISIDTDVDNYSKYWNTLSFNGINLDKNIFNVDQDSLADAENVYVDDDMSLISREPIKPSAAHEVVDTDLYEIEDIKTMQDIIIYCCKHREKNTYTIFAIKKYSDAAYDSKELGSLPDYTITIFYQYLICWNSNGAQAIDTNSFSKGWQSISNFAEIPITKVVTGTTTKELEGNQLTGAYKEQYVLQNTSMPMLPDVSAASEIAIKINTENGYQDIYDSKASNVYQSLHMSRSDVNDSLIYPEFTILRKLDFRKEQAIIVSARKNTIAIAEESTTTIYVSLTNGETFSKVTAPSRIYDSSGFGLSDDGECVFYVTTDCVYRLTLDDFVWTAIYHHNDESEHIVTEIDGVRSCNVHTAHYVNAETFAFVLGYYKFVDNYERTNFELCYKASGISDGTGTGILSKTTVKYDDTSIVDPVYDRHAGYRINYHYLDISFDTDDYPIITWLTNKIDGFLSEDKFLRDSNALSILTIKGRGNDTAVVTQTAYSFGDSDRIISGEIIYSYIVNNLHYLMVSGYTFSSTEADDSYTKGKIATIAFSYELGKSIESISSNIYNITLNKPIRLPKVLNSSKNSTISSTNYLQILSKNSYDTTRERLFVVKSNLGLRIGTDATFYKLLTNLYNAEKNDFWADIVQIDVAEDKIYIVLDNGEIYTNTWLDDDKIEIELQYDNSSSDYLNIVPKYTYSGSELYLADENTLYITNNTRDGENILFNLPKRNNQSFADNITGIINISTSELAVFFENGVTICTKSEDDDLGYVYYYNKSRLSLGLRDGDEVINVLDGSATVLPTVRGLALMSYQDYKATSDQVLEFISDKIGTIWKDFYNAGNVKIIQKQDYIYFVNGTKTYLMLDTRSNSWWKFKAPINLDKLITDQETVRIISNKLYTFASDYQRNHYYDLIDGKEVKIPWSITSQRLHFKYPNHYKNIRQLVFQLVETSEFKNTITAQIKIYRKVIDYGEPQLLAFTIDEYRTFVKRFNYWRVNELQWILSSDENVAVPAQFKINGMSIKYEIGEEVR